MIAAQPQRRRQPPRRCRPPAGEGRVPRPATPDPPLPCRSIRMRPSKSPASAATRSSRRQDLSHLPRRPAPPHRHFQRRRRRRFAHGPAPLRPRRRRPRLLHRLRPQHGRATPSTPGGARRRPTTFTPSPERFISVYGYERSVPYPNGHRNVLWPERGHRTLPMPQPGQPGRWPRTPRKLYAYLRQTDGICTSHTSATDQGTDWAEHDDALEPVVEIFQGYPRLLRGRRASRRRPTTRRIGFTARSSRPASCRRRWTRATASASRRRATTSPRTSATPASWPRSSAARG